MKLEQRLTLKPGEAPPHLLSSGYMSLQAWRLASLAKMEQRLASDDFVLLTGSSNIPLANAVSTLLERKIYYSVDTFRNGCVVGHIPTSVSGKHAIIIQSTQSSVNGDPNVNLIELLNMVDAAKKRMGAKYVTVVDAAPSDMRQDRKTDSGVAISAKLHADMLKMAGVDRMITLDLHAPQEQGFFDFPVDELYGTKVLLPYVQQLVKNKGLKAKMGAPDSGAEKRNRAWARRLHEGEDENGNIIQFIKEREIQRDGKPHIVRAEGDMEGYDVILADDVYSTGETLDNCADYAKKHGAKSVRAVVVHGEFLGRDGKTGVQILDESPLDEIIVTDSIDLPDEIRYHPKVRVVSVAPLIAEAIYRNLNNKSLKTLVD